jgi:hypothetical protein
MQRQWDGILEYNEALGTLQEILFTTVVHGVSSNPIGLGSVGKGDGDGRRRRPVGPHMHYISVQR